MPELPEVEILVRHLRPLLKRRTIRGVEIRRLKSLGGTPARTFTRTLTGATFTDLHRRGKYLIFHLRPRQSPTPPSINHQPSTINKQRLSTLNSLSTEALAKADQPLVAPKL